MHPSAWITMTATLGSDKNSEHYVVAPGGGGRLSIGGVGFSAIIQELGNWVGELVECIFTPSDGDSDVVATQTSVVDGKFANSQMLTCEIPPITEGETANVTLNWNGQVVAGRNPPP